MKKTAKNDKEIYELHASICQCLANPKRLEVIAALGAKEMSVSELAETVGISKSNMSQHLSVMRNKGILKGRRDGVSIYYSLSNKKVSSACALMREVLFEFINQRQNLAKG